MLVGQELAIRLINPKDALFRWSGPAFLGILERKEGRGRLESQVKRFLGTSFEHQIDTPGKSVTIPLKVTAHVFEVRDRTSPEICDDIEAFILRTSSDN